MYAYQLDQSQMVNNLKVHAPLEIGFESILTYEALEFLHALHIRFDAQRKQLLELRKRKQSEIDQGQMPDFLPETLGIRNSNWKVAPLPADLLDRRVEITGPVDRKMVINALNSGANVFMADFEDSNSPSWINNIQGQLNLRDAIDKTISFSNPNNGKLYQLADKVATLMVRPRGWHLDEKHITFKGKPVSGSLVDFGLFFYHNAYRLIKQGSGPYFYLPKIENHLEARLWNEVFVFAQEYLMIPQQTIKATVLIETILAAFEMDEILFELRDHSAGLNCGRWDYIFSVIKKFRNHPNFILPDRSNVGMDAPFMDAYTKLVIHTCHKRGVHAMGGMAAQIPIKSDQNANKIALEKVSKDKQVEVEKGHDGTWVAHPALVPIAMSIFNEKMPGKNQISKELNHEKITAKQLLETPNGDVTEEGVRVNINVAILYIESWLRGHGAVALYHLMEDAATAEISRSQLWQWKKHSAKLNDGRVVTNQLYLNLIEEELQKIKLYVGPKVYQEGKFDEATKLFEQLITAPECIDFLTIPAYKLI